MENPKQYIKEVWMKRHGKNPSPKIVDEILKHAVKSYALDETTPLETYVAWWAKTYATKSKLVKGKFAYYHAEDVEGPVLPERSYVIRPSATKHKKHHHHGSPWWKKILKGIALVTVSAVATAALLLFLIKALGQIIPDQKRVNDSDLAFATITVPEADNAYPYLDKLSDEVKYPRYSGERAEDKERFLGALIDHAVWNGDVAAEVLAGNETALADFRKAAEKSIYLNPQLGFESSKLINVYGRFPDYTAIQETAELMGINAMALVKDGKDNDGLDEALRIVKVGYLLEHAPRGFMFDYVNAMRIKNIGLKTVEAVVRVGRYTANERAAYAAELAKYQNDGTETEPFWKGTYALQNSIITLVATGGMSQAQAIVTDGAYTPNLEDLMLDFLRQYPSYYFYPNETRNILASLTRDQIASSQTSCDRVNNQAEEESDDVIGDDIRSVFIRNAVGKVMIQDVHSLSSIKTKMCKEVQLLEDITVLIQTTPAKK